LEKSLGELKTMVFEILLESKKPLMAKKIAFKIYRKYNGYRMSRFMVRDILWKEMKGQFKYDNVNYTYSIESENLESQKTNLEEDLTVEDLNKTSNNIDYDTLINKLSSKEEKIIIHDFKKLIKSNYLNVNTGNKKFDELLKSVVKDNKITTNEEAFLKEKSIELGLPFDLIGKAKEMLNSGNPYLDNIIHLIYEDGKITENEIKFLKEKEIEHEFTKSFVSKRFWQIGVCYYLNELIKIDGFKNVVKLREIGRILDFKLLNSDTWIILNLDIHTSNNINEIIENCQTKIEGKLNDYIKERYDFYNENLIESLYSEIDLRNTFLNEFKSDGDLEDYEKIIKILNQEKIRIGSPDANLLVENVKFRIQNNIWD